MTDEARNNDQLADELRQLRKEVEQLRSSETERKKAEEELAERVRQATLSAEIGATLVEAGDLRGTLQLSAEAVARHLDAAFARIWTLNERDNVLELQASAGMYTHIDGPHGRIPVGKYKIGRIAQERRPHLTNEVIGDPHISDPEWARREGMVAFAGHPLIVADRLVGVMAMFSRKPLKETALTALASTAHMIALAIERKKAEDRLREQKIFAESLIENSAVATFVLDPRHKIVFWNKACEELTGAPASDMVGTDDQWRPFYARKRQVLADIIIDSNFTDLSDLYSAYEHPALIKDGLHAEGWYPNMHGRDRYIIFDAAPIYDTRGELSFVIETLQDITERKRLEEALKESEGRLRTIIDTAPQCIKLIAADGTLLEMNPAGLRMIEAKSFARVRGKSIYTIVAPEYRDAYRALTEKAFGGVAGTLEFEVMLPSGARRWLSTHAVPFRDAKGEITALLGITEDITEHRRLWAQLLQAQKMEAVGQLAGGIAHDFNNILAAIIGYGHILHMKMDSDDPLRVNVGQILESADRAATLTQNLLAFSRKHILNAGTADLNVIVAKVEKFLLRLIGEDIEVRTSLGEEALTARVDRAQMEQALLNLATNARDAMPHGGALSIGTEALVMDDAFIKAHGFGEPGRFAVVSVTDTGVGMDKETKDKIFEPFFTTKEVGKGTGLGLAMVYGTVKQHRGHIAVYSEPGRGTTFRIFLPIVAEKAEEERKPGPVVAQAGGKETILVAEDEPVLRNINSKMLSEYGYRVILAENGEDAINKFRKYKDSIHLCLFDMIMPRKSGMEAYEAIRKIKPGVKVLFASGYAADRLNLEGLCEGFNFIQKPVSPEKLLREIRVVLDRGPKRPGEAHAPKKGR